MAELGSHSRCPNPTSGAVGPPSSGVRGAVSPTAIHPSTVQASLPRQVGNGAVGAGSIPAMWCCCSGAVSSLSSFRVEQVLTGNKNLFGVEDNPHICLALGEVLSEAGSVVRWWQSVRGVECSHRDLGRSAPLSAAPHAAPLLLSHSIPIPLPHPVPICAHQPKASAAPGPVPPPSAPSSPLPLFYTGVNDHVALGRN